MFAAPSQVDAVRAAARAFERDRYLTALLAPHVARDDLIALAAFAGDVGRIPSMVSQPMMGEIRLQWWRDAIDRAVSGTERSGHAIADALGDVVRRHGLETDMLHGFVDAHAVRLGDAPFADWAGLSGYLAATEAAQLGLAARVICGPRAVEDAALHAEVGQAYGLARLLLELPATLAEGRAMLPQRMLDAHGVTVGLLRSGASHDGLVALLAEVAVHAREAQASARTAWQRAARKSRSPVLPLALVEPYLRAWEGARARPLEPLDVAPLTRVWRIWRAHRFGLI